MYQKLKNQNRIISNNNKNLINNLNSLRIVKITRRKAINMTGYIYKITNTINGKAYLGQTMRTIDQRWRGHKTACKKGENSKLYNAMRLYGVENFTISKVYTIVCSDHSSLDSLEISVISFYNSMKNGYNTQIGGRQTNLGLVFSEYTKKKQSLAKIGKRSGVEHHAFGKPMPEATKQKLQHTKNKNTKAFVGMNVKTGAVAYYGSSLCLSKAGFRVDRVYDVHNGIVKTHKQCIFVVAKNNCANEIHNTELLSDLYNKKRIASTKKCSNNLKAHCQNNVNKYFNRQVRQQNYIKIQERIQKGELKHPRLGKKHSEDTLVRMSLVKSSSCVLKSPDGEIVKIQSIGLFCKQNGLNYSSIYNVVNGKRKSCFGWTVVKEIK